MLPTVYSSQRTRAAHPHTPGDISDTSANKIERLLKDLAVLHCGLPALLGALRYTCVHGRHAPQDPATARFERGCQNAALSADDIATLQESLMLFLPLPLQTQARALINVARDKGPQSAERERLDCWLASNLAAACLLTGLPDARHKPGPALHALAYAWGRLTSLDAAHLEFKAQFDDAKAKHLFPHASGSAAFKNARNAFNDAVRWQLVAMLPAIALPYASIQKSITGYENKRAAVLVLIRLHENMLKAKPVYF